MNKKKSDLEIFREQIKEIPNSEFSGYTDFQKLTPKQKIQWLDQLNAFKNLAKKVKKDSSS